MDSTLIFFLCLGVIVLFAYAVRLLINHNKYVAQRNYIKAEMTRSHSEREYKYWERKLRILKLSQMPVIGLLVKK